jgi:alanyl-tRNA synthetase
MKTSAEIRSEFLAFFKSKGHEIVASSSLVPGNDPTLLFTNSGMVQFKDMFLGAEKRSYTRATTSQRSLRAGGKHNDLENVGYTARHHTFFEMLGNFSFGDYFKRDAILYAWELLTKVYGLPAEKLWVTVYHTDDEAYDLWNKEIGVPAERIVRIADNKGALYASDNFWAMGDTGPCGPCTEIFYDHGPEFFGGPPGSKDEDGDRYIEIWNLVFMQFERSADGTMTKLPKPCVDTGMGLERLTAVLQHVNSNYDIDLMRRLVEAAAKATNTTDLSSPSLRVIADHIRACSFLIVDGVLPSNEGRGYVLRRIIRRALRHGHKLGQKDVFFHTIVGTLDELMGDAYPELRAKRGMVEQALKGEEERFAETLDTGMKVFERETSFANRVVAHLAGMSGKIEQVSFHTFQDKTKEKAFGDLRFGDQLVAFEAAGVFDAYEALLYAKKNVETFASETLQKFGYKSACYLVVINGEVTSELRSYATDIEVKHRGLEFSFQNIHDISISGRTAFTLYDTYGFPVDLTADVARERGLSVDMAGFEKAMEEQRERARAGSSFDAGHTLSADVVKDLPATQFLGYDALDADDLKVVGIVRDGKLVSELKEGESAIVILDRTPFYAESGGQVGDHGRLHSRAGKMHVDETVKLAGTFHGHIGRWVGEPLKVGAALTGNVDIERRQAVVLNHSATHLLHAALRKVLGEHVTQKGSLVAPDRLRFDFSHFQPIADADLRRIERMVNEEVRRNVAAEVHNMGMQEAIEFGAMALFGEKYGERVRVLKMGEFSTELCGGTHVARTGDIGLFKIIAESGVAAGIRRIEAVTGAGAEDLIEAQEGTLEEVARLLSTSGEDITHKLKKIFEKQRELERELESLKAKAANVALSELASVAKDIKGIKVVAARIDGLDAKALRDGVDNLKQALVDCVVLLAAGADGKVALIAGVHGAALGKVKAGELIAHVAAQIGGKGGGRPDMAQGGGEDGPKVADAIDGVKDWVAAKLG